MLLGYKQATKSLVWQVFWEPKSRANQLKCKVQTESELRFRCILYMGNNTWCRLITLQIDLVGSVSQTSRRMSHPMPLSRPSVVGAPRALLCKFNFVCLLY